MHQPSAESFVGDPNMFRVTSLMGLAILGAALLVGSGESQEKKDKAKGQLPPGWKKLDLSKEQILKIYDVQGKYKARIRDLEKQIADLRGQEKTEMIAVLTNDQKEMLRKLTLGDDTKKKTNDK